MSRREGMADSEWRAEAEAFIHHFVGPTKRDRYLSRPELLSEGISHDLEAHLDAKCAIALTGHVHDSESLIAGLFAATGNIEHGYCLVAGGWCPKHWRDRRKVPIAELRTNLVWWNGDVLFTFANASAAYFAAEAMKGSTRALLIADKAQRARTLRVLDTVQGPLDKDAPRKPR